MWVLVKSLASDEGQISNHSLVLVALCGAKMCSTHIYVHTSKRGSRGTSLAPPHPSPTGHAAFTRPIILPPIRGSQPEVIRSCCHSHHHHHHHHHHHKVFAGRLTSRGTRTRLPRRARGAWPARRRRETLERRRPLAMSHRRNSYTLDIPTGAPLERGGGGGSKVLAVCHPTLALGRSSRLAPSLSSSAQHTTSSTSPLPPRRQRAQPGEHMWAPGRAAPPPSAPSALREAVTRLPRAPGRAAPMPSAPSA